MAEREGFEPPVRMLEGLWPPIAGERPGEKAELN